MKISDKLIASSVKALTDGGGSIVVDGKYNSVYKGYISTLGASIVQAGLLPSILFFENSSSSAQEKNKLIIAIKYVLADILGYQFDGKFSKYILEHPNCQRKILSDVEKVAVGLKLALRMFETNETIGEE